MTILFIVLVLWVGSGWVGSLLAATQDPDCYSNIAGYLGVGALFGPIWLMVILEGMATFV